MYQLIYVSSATRLFSRQELLDLLAQSRAKNARLGITGLLLYRDGNIVQVLEGEEAMVRPLFATISADPRHKGLIVLWQGTVAGREFADWAMGFRDLTSPEVRALPGYSEFLNTPLDGTISGPRARRLLALFKSRM